MPSRFADTKSGYVSGNILNFAPRWSAWPPGVWQPAHVRSALPYTEFVKNSRVLTHVGDAASSSASVLQPAAPPATTVAPTRRPRLQERVLPNLRDMLIKALLRRRARMMGCGALVNETYGDNGKCV